MKICPSCLERFPSPAERCPRHPERPLLRLASGTGDALIGTLLDERYLVLEPLGEGAMGVVYTAWQLRVHRLVAVKVMRPELSHPELRARFAREAEATARLSSRHTVAVYDSGQLADGTLYLAMALVPGRNLADVLEREGPLPLPRIRSLALQLCDSLAEAHALGLVHRDIKAANLMVAEQHGEEHLTVLDFGVVKVTDLAAHKLTRDGMAVGSLSTMSPEQIDGRDVGPPADIYGVGVTLFHLATGAVPFDAPTPVALMYQHLSEPPPHLMAALGASPAVAALDAVLQRCMRKDPLERFASAVDLKRALESLPTGDPRPASPTRRPAQRTRTGTRLRAASADPAEVPGVRAQDVQRRMTERRLARPVPMSAPTPRARRARAIAFGLALALGVAVLLDAILTA